MDDTLLQAWWDAAMEGDVPALNDLLHEGVDIDVLQHDQTALMLAASFHKIEAVRFLLDHGADAGVLGGYGESALMSAASGGYMEIVRLLAEHGVDVNAHDGRGNTPYDFAKWSKHIDVAGYLWSRGGRPGHSETVLVLGAGFTKGFYESAPLLVDTFEIADGLLPKYCAFEPARVLLEAELERQKAEDEESLGRSDLARINMERLMTRLAGGMPYDEAHGAKHILDALLADLKGVLLRRIQDARQVRTHEAEMKGFAAYCLLRRVNFITFNYDEILDESLEHMSKVMTTGERKWHPNRGYGFYCKPARNLAGIPTLESNPRSMPVVLKLHGSMNWFPRRGAAPPFRVDDIVHVSRWSETTKAAGSDLNALQIDRQVKQHIGPTPFIVPPVLTKSDLVDQPLLQLLWSQAFDLLRAADQVIFVGYSLPVTDIAASQLFSEACRSRYPTPLQVKVVDHAASGDEKKREQIKTAYRKIFPGLPDDRFFFDGALPWATEFEQENGAELLARLR